MEVPEGLFVSNSKGLKLHKVTYNLVQIAREFYKKSIDVIKGFWFVASKSDSCLLPPEKMGFKSQKSNLDWICGVDDELKKLPFIKGRA
jgi:hypothetical protein